MVYVRSVKFNITVSLVVCPIDDYTAEPRSGGNIHVFLKDNPKKPVRKSDGYYVFTDLTETSYDVLVESDIYLAENVNIVLKELDPANPIAYLNLKPNSVYPFPLGATLVRVTLRDQNGNALQNAKAVAAIMSSSCAVAKLAQDGLKKGSSEIGLINVSGKISVGDMFLIKEKEEVCSEYCKIVGVSRGKQLYNLARPLQFNHIRGALLLPAIETRNASNGEVVIYFRNTRAKHFNAKIEFIHDEKSIVKELELTEGKTNYLGVIQV